MTVSITHCAHRWRVSEWVGFNGTSTQFRSLPPILTQKGGTESTTVKESWRYINLANLYNKRRYVCLSVCLSVSMFRMAGQTAGPIETKLDTHSCSPRECFCQGQYQGHSCTRAAVTELRNTWNAARKRHLANAYKTPSGRRVITASAI